MKRLLILLALIAVSCSAAEPTPVPEPTPEPVPEKEKVEFEMKAKDKPASAYQTYKGRTVENIPGFTPGAIPELDKYGGLKSKSFASSGWFRVEKEGNRWWMVDPEGHAFIAASVGEFVYGASEREKTAFSKTFVTTPRWAANEMKWIKGLNFTALGRGNSETVMSIPEPNKLPYCVYSGPMTSYVRHLINDEKFNIPNNTPIVFDEGYDAYLVSGLSWLTKYADDKYCIGIFTDNELFWTDDLLKIYLTRLPDGNVNRTTAQSWFDERKGKIGASISEATAEDKDAFKAFCLDKYLSRTLAALKTYDPNHMFIGQRFYKWTSELSSQAMMEVAGKYMDIVSINFYTKWEPLQEDFDKWSNWSGRPIMISEFYTKGEDSGLPNNTGDGWIVQTQDDRGAWYENFVIKLIATGKCVAWQWFKYQDNDPEDTTADASNIDSNKGIVKWDFSRYTAVTDHMKKVNGQIYNLAEFYK